VALLLGVALLRGVVALRGVIDLRGVMLLPGDATRRGVVLLREVAALRRLARLRGAAALRAVDLRGVVLLRRFVALRGVVLLRGAAALRGAEDLRGVVLLRVLLLLPDALLDERRAVPREAERDRDTEREELEAVLRLAVALFLGLRALRAVLLVLALRFELCARLPPVRLRAAGFFFDDFFEDCFDAFGDRALLLRELLRLDKRLEREELRVDALDFERCLGDFAVLARRVLFFDDFLDADLEDAAEAARRLEPLGARARRVARRAPLREVLLRRLPFGALGVLARRNDARLEDFREDLLAELLLRFFEDFGDFALRRLLDTERLAFLIFSSLSPDPLLRERFLLTLIPMSLLRLATISALYASRSATNFW